MPLKIIYQKNMYEVLISTFNCWSDKEIQIPTDILNKTIRPDEKYYPDLALKLDYLKNNNVLNNGRMKSTQNFLQGMFNYASSYKAVCCANYTYYIWKKIYPNSKLFIEHMEHSDDYVTIIMYENEEDFVKYRVLNKIMMRFHGYSDSDRKTNCQPYFMEFVSLISFNGMMLYPQIKKSKEINLSLPCTGYQTDIEAAYSRMGECMRVGCNQSFLYFFQRLHNICVAEAYSLLDDMHNNVSRFMELVNRPIEMFGLPDLLPFFSLYCRGNGNNYRLYTYGDSDVKNKIE